MAPAMAVAAGILSSCGPDAMRENRGAQDGRARLSEDALRRLFANPPNEYRIIQYGNPTPRQIETFRQYGIGGVMAFFHDHLRQPSDPRRQDPAAILPMLEAAQTNGFLAWLGDDFGYPSGMAGGRIVEAHPEYEVRGMLRLTLDGAGRVPATLEAPDVVEQIVCATIHPVADGIPVIPRGRMVPISDSRRVEAEGIEGPWRLSVFALRVIDSDSQAQSTMAQFGHTGRYPDLMNPAAVRAFLALFHGRLEREIGALSSRVEGFYTNEPNLMRLPWDSTVRGGRRFPLVPWNDEMLATFRGMHGYDLLPALGALFEGDDRESRRTRMHFYQTVAEMVTGSYARQIARWCEDRGILSGGHCLLEEYLPMHVACYGDMMKFASEFHVPAFDIGIPNPDRIESFPYRHAKFFSSVATWKERDTVIALPDPIIEGGGLRRLSPDAALVRNVVNRVFLYGGNQITSYLPLHPRKDGSARGYAAEEYRALSEYVGRLSLLLRGARQETAVALYYPIAMFQADYRPLGQLWPQAIAAHRERQASWDRAGRALLDADIDYAILHPEALREARIDGGLIRSGRGAYRYLVMPRVEILPLAALKQIRRFEAGGGTVLWVEAKPVMGATAREDAAVAGAFGGTAVLGAEDLPGRIPDPYGECFRLSFDTGGAGVSLARFRRGTLCIYYLINRGAAPTSVAVRSENPVVAETFDPSSGSIAGLALPARVEIHGFGSLLVVHPAGTGQK